MHRIERFRAMLRGHPVDHAPAGFWFHFEPAYHGGAAMAERHIAFFRETGLDLLKVMNDSGYGPVGTFRVHKAADWATLEPTPLSEAHFQSHLEGLQGIVAALGDEVPIITTAFNPFREAVVILRAGDPARYPTEVEARMALLAQLRQEPEPVLQGLQVIADDLARFYRACVAQAGAGGIYFSAKGGERDHMTDEEHAAWVAPYDLHVLRQVGEVAEYIVGHFCGVGLNLERFAGYPVHLANWAYQSDNPSLRQGQAILGGVSILGGLDERGPLVVGPRQALQREIEQALAEMGAQGFMLGAGCTVPGDTPLENLVYARQAIAELTAQ
jgi:uroporphyrinogen-III decarboxylase